MIFKYSSDDFKKFRDEIFNILRKETSKGNIDENKIDLVNVIYNLCLDNNIENLKKIDDLDLLCHGFSSSDHHPLILQSDILSRVYQVGKIEDINVNDVIDCLYLLFYADIYESYLISNDVNLRSYLEKCIKGLQDYSFFLIRNYASKATFTLVPNTEKSYRYPFKAKFK